MTTLTIRPAISADQTVLMDIAKACGLFAPEELDGFAEMTEGHFADPPDNHHWLVAETQQPIGAAYVTPEALAEDVWNLWFIGFNPNAQAKGHGTALLTEVETLAKGSEARLLLIETASGDDFDNTRGFYVARGYSQEATIRDYYGPGTDKVTFRKAL